MQNAKNAAHTEENVYVNTIRKNEENQVKK